MKNILGRLSELGEVIREGQKYDPEAELRKMDTGDAQPHWSVHLIGRAIIPAVVIVGSLIYHNRHAAEAQASTDSPEPQRTAPRDADIFPEDNPDFEYIPEG